MGAELAVIQQPSQLRAADKYDQREMIDVIKQTVCKNATDAQLKMFIEVCRTTGLNPFLKEIWYVAEKGIIMAGRDGYLRVANENPNFDGMETRVERDEKNRPIKAVCTVWRKDRKHPTICEAYYDEYKKTSPVWSQYPSAMIQKVAEVLALKRSFAINGIVTEEEVGHDGAGSVAAAREVAEQKLAGEIPLLEAEPVEDNGGLHADIVAAAEQPQSQKTRRGYNHFTMLEEVAKLKKRYLALGMEPEYYGVLRQHGVDKSNELPKDDGGVKARAAYKALQLRIADLEAADAAAFEALQNFADWPDDPLAPSLGMRIVIAGKRFRRSGVDADWKNAQ